MILNSSIGLVGGTIENKDVRQMPRDLDGSLFIRDSGFIQGLGTACGAVLDRVVNVATVELSTQPSNHTLGPEPGRS